MSIVVRALKYECGGCGSVVLVEHPERVSRPPDLPVGLHGNAARVTETGRSATQDWFACSDECVAMAVRRAAGDRPPPEQPPDPPTQDEPAAP